MQQPFLIAPPPSVPWKHITEVRQEALDYMTARQKGLITSYKTPWTKFNDSGINGLEWGSVTVLGSRPGVGKTAITNAITRNGKVHNPGLDYAVLDFQFEMSSKTTGVREFSNVLKMSYKDLLSADRTLDERYLTAAEAYIKMNTGDSVYQIEDPMTVVEIRKAIIEFVAFIRKPTVITIDHSVLIKKGMNEYDTLTVLNELGAMVTELKKLLPVLFIILTQMNRSIEAPERVTPGTIGNYPKTSDIFGGDALLQHCDIMAGINRPANNHLPYYGPEQFVVTSNLLAIHFLKVRNGEPSIAFFNADFANMDIDENITLYRKGQSAPSQHMGQSIPSLIPLP